MPWPFDLMTCGGEPCVPADEPVIETDECGALTSKTQRFALPEHVKLAKGYFD